MRTKSSAFALGLAAAVGAASAGAQMRGEPSLPPVSAAAMFGSAAPAWNGAVGELLKSPGFQIPAAGPIAALAAASNPLAARALLGPAVAHLERTMTPAVFAALPVPQRARALQGATEDAQQALAARVPELVAQALEAEGAAAGRENPALPAISAQLDMMRGPLSSYFTPAQAARVDEASRVVAARLTERQRRLLDDARGRAAQAFAQEEDSAPTPYEAAVAAQFQDLALRPESRDGLLRRVHLEKASTAALPEFPLAERPELPRDGGALEKRSARLADDLERTPNAPWVFKRQFAARLLERLRRADAEELGPLIAALSEGVRAHAVTRGDKGALEYFLEANVRRLRALKAAAPASPDSTPQQRAEQRLRAFRSSVEDAAAAVRAEARGARKPKTASRRKTDSDGFAFTLGLLVFGLATLHFLPTIFWAGLILSLVGGLFLAQQLLDKAGLRSWLFW